MFDRLSSEHGTDVFSHRVPSDLRPTAFAAAVARARAGARPLVDLTATNPTAVGLVGPADVLAPLADAAGCRYDPDPFGRLEAREAVAGDYRRRGLLVPRERILLTARTSEAYSFLFKLLCDPGDEVLVPQPSYPLFEHLTALDGVRAVPYQLEHHGVWSIDRGSVDRAWSPRTRVLLVVSPNNPTGSMLRRGDWAWLCDGCAARGVAVIGDEVFADYPVEPAGDAVRGVVGEPDAEGGGAAAAVLRFALGGLSKSAGLPQIKVGWCAVDGPDDRVAEAVRRLELIADTYLSVSTPAQVALPALIEAGTAIREAIADRVRAAHAAVSATAARHPACSVLRTEGGWSAVIRVPATLGEDALVTALVEEEGILVHPGYFFDFAHEAFLVVSLLTRPADLAAGLDRALARASR
jgi:hypothetical protein